MEYNNTERQANCWDTVNSCTLSATNSKRGRRHLILYHKGSETLMKNPLERIFHVEYVFLWEYEKITP